MTLLLRNPRWVLALTASALVSLFAWAASPATPSGKAAPDFSLKDTRDGKSVSLDGLKEKKAIVIVFTGTECPINNAYMPRLAQLSRKYETKGVQFLAINSNVQDTAERVGEHARKNELPFPVLKDASAKVADAMGARRTPEAFVLDSERKIRYQGRIDDQYGYGTNRGHPDHEDLVAALDAVLAGKSVAVAKTSVAGCVIAHSKETKATGAVTYAKEVSRIMQNRCQECHRPGQIGPFSLMTYRSAVNWSDTIAEVIKDGRMPPWYADPKIGHWSNDRRLSPNERDTLLAWIDQGCPKGDDKDMPAPRQFTQGWTIGKPDAIVRMDETFQVPADAPKTGIPYQYFEAKTNFTEDKWVVAAEAKPDAASVVHHIVVFIQPPGKQFRQNDPGSRVLCGTAPGDMPFIAPSHGGKRIPAGSSLVFQMHYTPNGKAQADRSSVGLIFAKEPVEYRMMNIPVLNPRFEIGAGDDNYQVESEFTFREDGHIASFMPHMHLRGKDFKYEAVYPDGKRETLLWVPRYNFNWQSVYRFAEPKAMPKGTKLHCTAHFDNSTKNPNNPDATETVRWGDQTWQEMMIGWTDFYYDKKVEKAGSN